MNQFDTILLLVADEPAKLRPVDLFRVLEHAERLEALPKFGAWLIEKRPDLSIKIIEAIREVMIEATINQPE